MGKKFKAGWYNLKCRKCDGEGEVENSQGKLKKCKKCNSKGKIEIYVDECCECGGYKKVECDCTGGLGKKAANDDCPACGGRGEHDCPACDGRGFDVDRLKDEGVAIDELWEDDDC